MACHFNTIANKFLQRNPGVPWVFLPELVDVPVAFLGLVVGVTGLILDFPNFAQTRFTMQVANIIHGGGALLFIAASIGHIYMGTIGTEGAYDAMSTGNVDETWAKEHHELWFDQIKS